VSLLQAALYYGPVSYTPNRGSSGAPVASLTLIPPGSDLASLLGGSGPGSGSGADNGHLRGPGGQQLPPLPSAAPPPCHVLALLQYWDDRLPAGAPQDFAITQVGASAVYGRQLLMLIPFLWQVAPAGSAANACPSSSVVSAAVSLQNGYAAIVDLGTAADCGAGSTAFRLTMDFGLSSFTRPPTCPGTTMDR
jgi:hypothetical protein